jgi:oligopeptide/dipeptide ABC transporter ATP-binding protein
LIMSDSRNLLEVGHLTKIFNTGGFIAKRELVAVDDVSFNIPAEKPTILTIAGESGSGKTTTARMVLGFIGPTHGEVIYRGKNILSMGKDEWKEYRREVQAIFQDPFGAFNPMYVVDHALKVPIQKYNLTETDDEARRLISETLEVVGLRPEEILGKHPHQLSGGQRQRIMLARAFLLRPRIVVADEPVSMLDASMRAGILHVMLDLKKMWNVSFLYITHDLSTAHYISDSIAIMYQGSIVEMGPIDDVIENPLHPYSRLLIDSIPIPDPGQRWKEHIELPSREFQTQTLKGCKFYDRCGVRMEVCKAERPMLRQERSTSVACHLYRAS